MRPDLREQEGGHMLVGRLAGWLVGRLQPVHLGHQIASKTHTLSNKVRRKCVPLSRKSISNRVRWRVEGSKSCTFRQKVWQKHVLLSKKSAPVGPRNGNEPLGDTVRVRVKRRCCQITKVFSCVLRHVGSDPQAEGSRGEVNLPHKQVLTLRFRVGGFSL